ncbi:MAG: hypothetical protein A2277_15080 [Desulfobacterales bacterium RIFOXYA12_FULL_46_15]|nr:MAG: hypothetical protein A2277_15080 [Desulfobacterales bacterium RIFOXYA12_FULL_46_15]
MTIEEIALNVNSSILRGIYSVLTDARPWGLNPRPCPVLWFSSHRENLASIIKKNQEGYWIHLELFISLFILDYYER